jgi:phosphoglycolate phosphatase
MGIDRNIKLIIFDLDGTLVDSLNDLTDATNAMLRRFGRRELNSREVRLLVGQGAKRLVERAMPDALPEEIDEGERLFVAYNEAHIADKTRLYPGVRETLAILGRFRRLAVISNKNAALCRKLLEVLEVAGHFGAIMGADSLPFRKPSPEPVLRLLADAGVTAAETVIVGDSSNDIIAGKGAGVVTIGCTYGYGEPSELVEADFRIDSFAALLDLPLLSRC